MPNLLPFGCLSDPGYFFDIFDQLLRPHGAEYLERMREESRGMPISAVAINMWRHFLEIKNLTDENKTPEEIASAEKEFREMFLNNTYRTNEYVQEITIVDSTNTHIPLEKQIVMFPEAGEFLESFCFFLLLTISISRRLSHVQNPSDEQDQYGRDQQINFDQKITTNIFVLCRTFVFVNI